MNTYINCITTESATAKKPVLMRNNYLQYLYLYLPTGRLMRLHPSSIITFMHTLTATCGSTSCLHRPAIQYCSCKCFLNHAYLCITKTTRTHLRSVLFIAEFVQTDRSHSNLFPYDDGTIRHLVDTAQF